MTKIAHTGTKSNNEHEEITKETLVELYKDLGPYRLIPDFLEPKQIKPDFKFREAEPQEHNSYAQSNATQSINATWTYYKNYNNKTT